MLSRLINQHGTEAKIDLKVTGNADVDQPALHEALIRMEGKPPVDRHGLWPVKNDDDLEDKDEKSLKLIFRTQGKVINDLAAKINKVKACIG